MHNEQVDVSLVHGCVFVFAALRKGSSLLMTFEECQFMKDSRIIGL